MTLEIAEVPTILLALGGMFLLGLVADFVLFYGWQLISG